TKTEKQGSGKKTHLRDDRDLRPREKLALRVDHGARSNETTLNCLYIRGNAGVTSSFRTEPQ
ncbi:MAG: hypothetical protein H7836_17505, partial [Magnetococcus sp. YQC-3]